MPTSAAERRREKKPPGLTAIDKEVEGLPGLGLGHEDPLDVLDSHPTLEDTDRGAVLANSKRRSAHLQRRREGD